MTHSTLLSPLQDKLLLLAVADTLCSFRWTVSERKKNPLSCVVLWSRWRPFLCPKLREATKPSRYTPLRSETHLLALTDKSHHGSGRSETIRCSGGAA